jgi:hypothetical protein
MYKRPGGVGVGNGFHNWILSSIGIGIFATTQAVKIRNRIINIANCFAFITSPYSFGHYYIANTQQLTANRRIHIWDKSSLFAGPGKSIARSTTEKD